MKKNIEIYFKLRETFIEYYELVREIFKDKDRRKFPIKNDAISYFEYDKFSFFLDQIMKQYIKIKANLNSIDKARFYSKL